MYLKRMEIKGFKSFADRTVIDFTKGVTAVVGPNGSGKSNITESLRWVLGEQSAKSLRGGKMPDIIFAGSEKRKPLNIAEVTVVLDNTERFLPLDFSEVSITRRLKRSGESEFFINKKAGRLRDIQELFMDSGLGKESFSIISQGKVEAIFNSKPEERRGIFEEAAGVLKYKQRKKEAERKLEETDENLARLEDILHELEEQLHPLREQSDVAKKYLVFREELKTIDVALTVEEIKQNKEIFEAGKTEFEQITQHLEAKQAELNAVEVALANTRVKNHALEEKMDALQKDYVLITEKFKTKQGEEDVLSERSKYVSQNAFDLEHDLATQLETLHKLSEELNELSESLTTKEEELSTFYEEEEILESELTQYSKTSKEMVDELRQKFLIATQEEVSIQNDLKYLEEQYLSETSKNQQKMAQYEQIQAKLFEAKKRLKDEEQVLETKKNEVSEKLDEFRKVQVELKEKSEILEIAKQKMFESLQSLSQKKARIQSLKDIQANYQGYYQGVKFVLQNKAQLKGILGSVAELIHFDKKYAQAVELALGGATQNVVVKTDQDAKAAISFLVKNKGGRATFLPINTIKKRAINAVQKEVLEKMPGFIGIASDVVKVEETVRPIIENLLGLTILAKDLETATQMARQIGFQYRVVSLDGQVMNPGGSMTGGRNKVEGRGNLFSSGFELEELENEVKQNASVQEKLEQEVASLTEEVTRFEQALEEKRNEGDRLRQKENEQVLNVEKKGQEVNLLKQELRIFEEESAELGSFLMDYEGRKETCTTDLTTIQKEKETLETQITHVEEKALSYEEKRSEIQEKLSLVAQKKVQTNEQLKHLNVQLAEKNTRQKELNNERKAMLASLELLKEDTQSQTLTKEQIQKQIQDLAAKKASIEEQLETMKEERKELHAQTEQTDALLKEKNHEQQAFFTQKSTVEIRMNRASDKLDIALTYLQEEYQVSFDLVKEAILEGLSMDEAKKQVKQLKREIDLLGAVNLSAIEQYTLVNERFAFLDGQKQDLLEAKASLYETMSAMDEEVKVRFKETFDAIRHKFNHTFPSMFGGGRADLILSDPEDLLYTGIEISAQPPGKKMQHLSLLSGGERALTAIALLFSIIQVRPVPFCVLDEVEAALDEANVARFGHYLSHFEDATQFIVVTHRRGTMESANVLYGVTMQESGVSSIVSVKLEEVAEDGALKKN